MKSICAVILVAACAACTQQISTDLIPQSVRDAFARSYPNAREVEWEQEKPGEFEVSFETGEEELSVVYSAQGEELEVEREIPVSQLPEAIRAALTGKKIKEAEEIKRKGQTYYEVEVGGKDLYFDANGKQLTNFDD